MKKHLYLFLYLVFSIVNTNAQTSNISAVINNYVPVTNIFSGTCIDSLQVSNASSLTSGNNVLLIQMQGAVIDSSNSVSFGTITTYGNSGNYEFLKIASINGTIIHFTTMIKNNYDVNGGVQLVTIPSYVNAIVTGTLTAMRWNGTTGGVLVFTASGTVTLNADINLDGYGFRGGPLTSGTFDCGAMDYYYSIPSYNGGKKGEGIAAYITNKECGRGAQANGGGGGNNNNAGGAGGGNYGQGGRGGNQVLFQSCTPLLIGGEAGKNLNYTPVTNKIFLGGGGGGGQQNDNNNVGVDGKNGGGLVIIGCDTLIGNNHTLSSDGLDNYLLVTTDGAGGGGAGGTILLDVNNFTSNLNIEAQGGKGGSSSSSIYCLGTGGGGGGGVILYSHNILPPNVVSDLSGGIAGMESNSNSSCSGSNWGAGNGQDGSIVNNWVLSQVPFANAGPDKTICQGDQVQIGTPPVSGCTYSWNNGAGNVANPFVSPLTTTTYILTVSTNTCLYLYDTVTVFVNAIPPTPTIMQSNDTLFCTFDTSYFSFQWYFDNAIISGATDSFYVETQNGNYNLAVSNKAGCSVAVGIIILGIHGNDFNTVFSLFPNPVNDRMTLCINKVSQKVYIEINDISGRALIQKNFSPTISDEFHLDVSSLSPGIYFISIRIDGNVITERFIK